MGSKGKENRKKIPHNFFYFFNFLVVLVARRQPLTANKQFQASSHKSRPSSPAHISHNLLIDARLRFLFGTLLPTCLFLQNQPSSSSFFLAHRKLFVFLDSSYPWTLLTMKISSQRLSAMASLQVLRPTISPLCLSQSKFPRKSGWAFQESCFQERVLKLRSFSGSVSCRRFRVFCKTQETENQNNGKFFFFPLVSIIN